MADTKHVAGTSEVEATPDAAERVKPDAPKPGTVPGASEADAKPDEPVRDETPRRA